MASIGGVWLAVSVVVCVTMASIGGVWLAVSVVVCTTPNFRDS